MGANKKTGDQVVVWARLPVSGDLVNDVLQAAAAADGTGSTYKAVGCLFSLTPTGHEFEQGTADECLEDTGVPTVTLGNEQPDIVEFAHAFTPGGTAGLDANQSTTEQLRSWAVNKTNVLWRIEYPASTISGVNHYEVFQGQIQSFKPASVSKREFMQLPVQILRNSNVIIAAKP